MVDPAPRSASTEEKRPLDLSQIRHDLRTAINHILGYCEMLQEQPEVPPSFRPDLQKIHAGGKHLHSLINEYFDEETFESKQHDPRQLCHELRTPVNHIVGYTELLEEMAEEQGLVAVFSDLDKIREAACSWLQLMEEYLVQPRIAAATFAEGLPRTAPGPVLIKPGIGFAAPAPGRRARVVDGEHLLVVDDDAANRDMLSRRLSRLGYEVSLASSGLEALRLLRAQSVDLLLLDMVMPGLDGYRVLSKIKADPSLSEIPVIMISALDQENSVARCIEAGADDYVPKPFNSAFLRARIGACLEKRRLREKERRTYEALLQSQKHLAAELAEAAAYVKSLLPRPLSGSVQAEWCFQPSAQLGGDAFGYHWLDPDHLAIYLIDVCGHGVGAALLSVSVLNALRAQTLGGADFEDPALVLSALNRMFPMDAQNHLFFSAWYGVYQPSHRMLRFGSGGHPPALLLEPDGKQGPARLVALRTEAPAVGCFDQAQYASACQPVAPHSRLLVFTDGVFEIFEGTEKAGTWQEFFESLQDPKVQALRPQERLLRAQQQRGAASLEDDYSLMDLRFC